MGKSGHISDVVDESAGGWGELVSSRKRDGCTISWESVGHLKPEGHSDKTSARELEVLGGKGPRGLGWRP